MKNDSGDNFYSCILLISNTEDRFLIVPSTKQNSSTYGRWELPNFGHYNTEFDPVDMTIWLTETFFRLKIKESDLRLKITAKDNTGAEIHLFENKSLTSEINDLFENEGSKLLYRTMSYHHAGLSNSGLDSFHKEMLARSGLIKIHNSPFKKIYSVERRMRNYVPKPL